MNTTYIALLPSLSILLFTVLYLLAARQYPGGSQADANAQGFDWVHNYWCDLLGEEATNGAKNLARPYGITAMGILGIGLTIFCYQFPNHYPVSPFWNMAIPITGGIAMFLTFLLFTPLHNMMIGLASIAGLVTLIGIFTAFYQHQTSILIGVGIFCAVLMVVNNYIYYTGQFIYALPLLQKITFLIVLLWLVAVNFSFLEK